MNLVAHQYLSFGERGIQIGNLLGEIVKGNQYENFSEDVKTGILLHRTIDTFTDEHEIVKRSSSYFYESQHKYSPIVIDVIFDYFLIKHWDKFYKDSFENFKKSCYSLFEKEYDSLPKKLQETIYYLLKYDWFKNYSSIEGVQKTLKGIGNRSKFENNLHQVIPEFEKNYKKLEQDFLEFFPQLINCCQNYLGITSDLKKSF
ncbi:Acyl carrier protein phosphodiesterase [Chishuiella changwenlii]|uniref:ACP phosphodiesterase n=1 Tax=Chishuiella changwenlii TaxID=1434701 RepID=A0A1M6U2T8_9FLAO|nr:acyl carrier protein phosphodiesterase [Chishuiella changwenlii]GGF08785.1 ACP phosphodiesterase [Chishuiella changwenlii]SHK63464.1 Acyl carrier protein phosphodiesterase [Chishuiella changwenlii]